MLFRHVPQRRAIDLAQPEQKAAHIRVSPQIAKVLCGYKRPVVLSVDERAIVDWVGLHVVIGQAIQHGATTARVEEIYQALALRRQIGPDIIQDRRHDGIDKTRAIQICRVLRQKLWPLHKRLGQFQLGLRQIGTAYYARAIPRKGLNSSMAMTLTNSTVSGNNAYTGGGIDHRGALLNLINSTVSGNSVTGDANVAGGIFVTGAGTLTLTNSTISNNAVNTSGGSGGGIANNSSTVNLENTIVANNSVSGGGSGPDLLGAFNSQDYNLIGNTTGATFTGTTTHNKTNVDPRLAPLTNNGGLTQTQALLAGSPALDAGDNSVTGFPLSLTTDQRGTGFARQVDGPDADTVATVDIGAFEAQVSVEDITDKATNEDTQLQFSFNVGGSGSITSITATSSNTALVPNNAANLVVTGSSSTRTVTINPAADQFGTATISVTVNGTNRQSMTDTFVVTINPVNDSPMFTKGLDQTVNNNAGTQIVNNWANNLSPGPANEANQTLSFVITNNTYPSLFATAPAISSTGALSYAPAANGGGSATITVVLQDNGGTANGGHDTSPPQTFTINVNPVGGFLQFSSANFTTTESSSFATITVVRLGDKSLPVTVDFATGGDSGSRCSTVTGMASPKCDFTEAFGTLRFAAGEDSKTFRVLITQDAYVEGPERVMLALSNTTGFGALGTPATANLRIDDDASEPPTNPIDDVTDFVRQHYHDFLNREPDQGGFDFWTSLITQCGNDQVCIRTKRIDVSNAFFYELEYQQTGSYVYRLYRAAFGNNQPFPNPDNSNPAEANKLVSYAAFTPDRARVVGGASLAQAQLDLSTAFVQRAAFISSYASGLDGPAYVDALLATIKNDIKDQTGLPVDLGSQRQALIDLYNQSGGGNAGRGAVIYRLADDNTQTNPINNRPFIDAEYNRAFVTTQYFGYLRRDPDIGGFLFWLGQVNSAPLRDVPKQHAMVCSFITSAEYQQRFSSLVTHTNVECQ